MKKLLLILLFPIVATAASWTDFYVQTTGDNLNSGHTPQDAAMLSRNGGTWDSSTGVYTKAGMDPVANGVTNGAWASVYPDLATTNVFVGRITAADDTADTITVSILAKAGTVPATDGVGATSIRVGGAWRGPNTNGINVYDMGFPFNFAVNTLTNSSGNVPMVNIKGGTSYFVSNAITHSLAGPIHWQGYTNAVRDGGKAIIDGGVVSTAYVLFTLSGINNAFTDLIFDRNGAAGNASGVSVGNNLESVWTSCVFRNMRQSGLLSVGGSLFIECEAYGNNTQGSAAQGGFGTGTDLMLRCVAHDNLATTASAAGFIVGSGGLLIGCMSYNNGNGIGSSATTTLTVKDCNTFSNAGFGLNLAGASAHTAVIENCNFFKNGTFGINSSGSAIRNGRIINCVFGSGTQTNVSGGIGTTINAGVQGGLLEQGSTVYGSNLTPWVDPTNGNFTMLSSATTKAAGRATFTQVTVNAPTNTVSYPDIGAAQGASTNSASSGSRPIIFLQ